MPNRRIRKKWARYGRKRSRKAWERGASAFWQEIGRAALTLGADGFPVLVRFPLGTPISALPLFHPRPPLVLLRSPDVSPFGGPPEPTPF